MQYGMFYTTDKNQHGLPHDPFKSCVVPRPIGWISSISAKGIVNLSPYSFFNGVASDPPIVVYGSSGRTRFGDKDTLTNISETGEFVVNIATWDLRDAMNRSSASLPPDVDEFEYAGLEAAPSELVRPPRVKASPIHLECVHHQTIELPHDKPDTRNALVLGRVVGVHIDDSVLTEGLVDLHKVKPIARLGYLDYALVDTIFTMPRPKAP